MNGLLIAVAVLPPEKQIPNALKVVGTAESGLSGSEEKNS